MSSVTASTQAVAENVVSTVIAPAALIALSFVFTLFLPPSAHSRSAPARDDPPPAVLAYSPAYEPGAPGSGGESEKGDRPPGRPVDRFYRFTAA